MPPITLDQIRSTLASRVSLAPNTSLSRVPALAAVGIVTVGLCGLFQRDVLEASVLGSLAAAVLACAIAAARRGREERTLGAYRLDEKIGEGGMGVVYKASHAFLQRPAAIKLLPPERAGERDRKRFEREVQRTSKLSHPNTISIYDFGRTAAGTFYYAMEYVDGCDLQTLIERHGPQDPARVAHVLAQLAGSLVEAHRAGLIHRDVKPANVMLCERGGIADVVKVLDFGLSRELDSDAEGDCDEGSIVGTPLYLSPEALTAPDLLDARSDLYAVGAVGYFLLTGQTPFSGTSLLEVCEHHLYSTPVPPSQRVRTPIPTELEALILACLAKSPRERPESAAALQTALLRLAAEWTQPRAAAWWNEHGEETAHTDGAAPFAQTAVALTGQLAA